MLTTQPTLTAEQRAKLAALANFATRYEVVMTQTDGASVLLGYTSRKTKAGLYAILAANGKAIVAALGLPDDARTAYTKGEGFTLGVLATVNFGRTQRESIIEGERPRLA